MSLRFSDIQEPDVNRTDNRVLIIRYIRHDE